MTLAKKRYKTIEAATKGCRAVSATYGYDGKTRGVYRTKNNRYFVAWYHSSDNPRDRYYRRKYIKASKIPARART